VVVRAEMGPATPRGPDRGVTATVVGRAHIASERAHRDRRSADAAGRRGGKRLKAVGECDETLPL